MWQRPNHILSRLARLAEVLVVEEEAPAEEDAMRLERHGGVVVLTPLRRLPGPGVDERTLEAVRRFVRGRSAMLWLYTPLMLQLASAVPQARIVYDKMDELAAFKDADPALREGELRLCARADFVFAGGRTLWESVRDRVRNGAAFPSGVEAAPFALAAERAALAPRTGENPVFGYVGVLDERLDLDLIAAVARARPDARFVFVGPVTKIDPSTLPRASNLRYDGAQPYDALPAIVARFDVALMPFARNEATRSISPTKTLEYLAARRPVVSTAIADVAADFGDIVYVAEDTAHFIAALAVAERGDAARAARGVVRAASMSWDSIVDGMLAALGRARVIDEPWFNARTLARTPDARVRRIP